MAAYNSGGGRVRHAVRRIGSRDFWHLANHDALPDETANYVPKFQAAMIVARNPEKYGFTRPTIYDFPRVQCVRMPGRMHLAEIARQHRVSVETVTALNPHLLRGRTPRSSYQVWLPVARG
jgi:membrane-bound lytic murein transglycosylase D